uniref:Uncharacterized protein n=1 Tax=Kalanchoe fedtschenkoi TaxID=63787 RepID=A0A7N0V1Q7_KALFE
MEDYVIQLLKCISDCQISSAVSMLNTELTVMNARLQVYIGTTMEARLSIPIILELGYSDDQVEGNSAFSILICNIKHTTGQPVCLYNAMVKGEFSLGK